MKKSAILLTLLAFLVIGPAAEAQDLYTNNRAPLVHKQYMELPLGAVKPDGWLKDQLDIMAAGMTGHLDQLVPKIFGERNGWPTGMYGGDEYLHGANPTQGTECCSVVELMFSLEKMIEITGRTDWADWLENHSKRGIKERKTQLPKSLSNRGHPGPVDWGYQSNANIRRFLLLPKFN